MSQRTEKIAQQLLEKQTGSGDLTTFLNDIEEYLKAIKNEVKNTISHKGLANKEIPEFLRDVFPEIEKFDQLLDLLKIFGLNIRHDAYVFFDQEKSGFLMTQQPLLSPLDSIQRSYFCLLSQTNEKGDQILTFSGINGERILTADYVYSKQQKAYERQRLNIGIDSHEEKQFSPTNPSIKIKPRYLISHKIITKTMLKKASLHDLYIDFSNQPVSTNLKSLQIFQNIPLRIATT